VSTAARYQSPSLRVTHACRKDTIDPGVPAAIFGLNFSYDLPIGKGKRFLAAAPRLVDNILGGWTVTGFMRYQSGSALQIWAINPFASILGYSSFIPMAYANYTGKPVYKKTDFSNWDPMNDRYLSSEAFTSPALFSFGNTARYLDWARGPWMRSESLSFSKAIAISERINFRLGADFVNPFNIVRWGNPSTMVGPPTFGQITTTQGSRKIQINVALDF
jgi:hypothetical protein